MHQAFHKNIIWETPKLELQSFLIPSQEFPPALVRFMGWSLSADSRWDLERGEKNSLWKKAGTEKTWLNSSFHELLLWIPLSPSFPSPSCASFPLEQELLGRLLVFHGLFPPPGSAFADRISISVWAWLRIVREEKFPKRKSTKGSPPSPPVYPGPRMLWMLPQLFFDLKMCL